MHLLIVESPAKAKKIIKYLGREYKVLASYGKIKNFLSKIVSLDPVNIFQRLWKINAFSKKF